MKIEGKDVLLIAALPGEHKYNVDEKSPMFGKTYKRYAFGGKVFTSNDPNFATQVENGGLDTVTMDSNEEGQLSLTGFITSKQALAYAKSQKQLKAIDAIEVKAEPLTANELAELLA